MDEDILSLQEKKVVKWGEGLVVFITKEIKRLGLKAGDKVRVVLKKDEITIKK